MKTHKEISEAIDSITRTYNLDDAEWGCEILTILDALNDRIENLSAGLKSAHDAINDIDQRV